MKFFILVLLSVFSFSNVFASARVMPTKVFLDTKSRSFKISIKNKATESKWFSIKTVFYRMGKDGSMKKVDKPEIEEKSASKLIRFSPKRVFLKPDQEQIVRISLRKKPGLEDGEYRTHLFIVEDELSDKPSASGLGKIGMDLRSRVAVAIPVLYRHGKVTHKIKMNQFKVAAEKDGKYLNFNLENTGNTFVFGTLEAYFVPEGDVDKRRKVLFIKGVSSYLKNRSMKYKFNVSDKDLKNGKLEVFFREDDLRGGGLLVQEKINL